MYKDVLGYRAKIGIVVPETNTVVQPECEAMRPRGVTNHVGRMPASGRQSLIGDMDAYARSLQPSLGGVTGAIRTLLPCEPAAILVGHSINSFWGGVSGAQDQAAQLRELAGGTPVLLPSLAMVAALKALVPDARRVALLTPYFPPGDALVTEFLSSAGYEVCATFGLRCAHPLDIASRDGNQIKQALRKLLDSKPDAVVQPGTNLPTSQFAAEAEREFGVPFLACNTAAYWYTLRSIGIRDGVPGLGRLLETC